jgi:Reverse transcriptase (RNA-dependent DNA polymerase)
VADCDLSKAFDKIDHSALLARLGSFPARDQIRGWLKAGVIEKRRYAPTEEGTPQGGLCAAAHNPPYLYRSVTASVRLGRLGSVVGPVLGVPESAPCPRIAAGFCERAGGSRTGREPGRRSRRRRRP